MDRKRRAAAWAAIGVSTAAFIVALFGGAIVSALEVVLRVFGLGSDLGPSRYPLGSLVFLVYLAGVGAGACSMRWPAPASAAMVVLALVAYLLGGPIAKIFGVLVGGIGGLLALHVLLRENR